MPLIHADACFPPRLFPRWMKFNMHRRFIPHHMHLALLKPIQIRILKLQVVGEMHFGQNQIGLNQSKTAKVKSGN